MDFTLVSEEMLIGLCSVSFTPEADSDREEKIAGTKRDGGGDRHNSEAERERKRNS